MEAASFRSRLVKTAFTVKQVVVRRQEERLVRKLGRWDLTLLGVGASIGAGIFVLTGIAAKQAGPAVCLSFLLAAAMCILNALAYAELSSRFPESGSAYLYAHLVFGEVVAVVTGVNLLIDYHVGAASIARSLVGYLAQLCQDLRLPVPLPPLLIALPLPAAPFLSLSLLAPLVLLLITLVLLRGVQESAFVSNALTVLKMGIILLVIAAGLTVSDAGNLTPFAPEGAQAVIETSALVFFAYVGFDAVSNAAEECVRPRRDLPFGIIASLLLCAALYMAVTLVLCSLVSYRDIDEDAPLTSAFRGLGMHWVQLVVDAGALIGLSTTLLVGLYSQARIYLGIARDGLLPKPLAAVHPLSGTPATAQLLCFAIAALLAFFFDVRRLSSVLSIGIIFAYTTVCAAVLHLRVDPLQKPALTPLLSSIGLFAAACGFASRYGAPRGVVYACAALDGIALVVLWCRLEFSDRATTADGSVFVCPWVPLIPALGVALNLFMMAQLAWEAWVRLVLVTVGVLGVYVWKVWGDECECEDEGNVDSSRNSPLLESRNENAYGSTERG